MKTTRWKKIGIVLAVLTLVLIAAALIIPRLVDLNRYNGLISSEIEKATGGRVTLGHLAWGISKGIWLEADRFAVESATVFPGDLELSRILAKVSILPLLSKRVVVDQLLLDSPVVTIRLAPSPAHAKKAPKPDSAPPTAGDDAPAADKQRSAGSPLPVEILIERLNVQNGRIHLEDSLTLPGQKLVRNFTDVSIEATDLAPGQEMNFQLALRDEFKPGLGSLKGQGTFTGLTKALTLENPDLNLKVTLSDLDVDTLRPYLKTEALAQRLGGSISLEVNYEGDLGQHFSADGQVDLSRFAYTDPSMWEKPFPGTETKIAYQVTIDPQQVRVESLKLSLGEVSLMAEGLLRDWRKEPVIKGEVLSSDVPLVELIPLVPWKELGEQAKVFRQVLEGGGKVVLDKAVLPELSLTHIQEKPKTLLSMLRGSIRLVDISVRPSPELPKVEHLKGTLHLEKGVFEATDIQARMGPLTLPTLEVRATNLIAGKPRVSAVAKGPMRLIGSSDASVEKLLRQYGLKSLSGSAEVDMSADYDQSKPKSWVGSGSLLLEGVKAVSHPAGVRLDGLNGRVTFNRKKTLGISVANLRARVNKAPIELEGQFSRVGTPQMVVDAKARAEQLDLEQLSSLLPPLKDLGLGGKLDMDVNVHYPQAKPAQSTLNGEVTTIGLAIRLPSQNITVKDGDADIELVGNGVKLKGMTLRANDQKLILSGQLSDFQKPNARLQVNSPNLNVDRLLPPTQKTPPTSNAQAKKESAAKTEAPPEKQTGKPELPPFLRKLTAQLQADAKRGKYRGQEFQDLRLKATYQRGLLKNHQFQISIAGGRIQTTGNADLRNLERIPFTIVPAISAVRLESIAPLLGYDKVSAHGPLTMTGKVAGRTGRTQELLGSLRGQVAGDMGPGRLHKLDSAGDALFKILTFIKLKGIFSGKMTDDLEGKGIPYDSLNVGVSFQDGNMSVNKLALVTPALTLDGQGTVDLVNRQLNMSAHVKTLGTEDGVLSLVPVVGKAAEQLSDVYLDVDGSLEKPKIRVRPAEGVEKAVEGEAEAPVKGVEDLFRIFDQKKKK
ncbi:MAG: AsmA-like C-terminal domain-containing protein [Deltaproteobacteria bacterium]|nr:MAG: AsmA-like C-terminal domain-containing protein [Deltaproteobacteria bacterium]